MATSKVSVVLSLFFLSFNLSAYTGHKSSEAILKFEAFVDTNLKTKNTSEVDALIEAQVNHLFGTMTINRAKVLAAPKGDDETTNWWYEKKIDGTYRVHYEYEGTIVVEQRQGVANKTYEVIIPNNPHDIFDKTNPLDPNDENPCTDTHYKGKEDFWYFWSPFRPNCRKVIKENEDYQVIQAQLIRKKNTQGSMPDYERLADKNGDIRIYLLMGMDDPNNNRNPFTPNDAPDADLNGINYGAIYNELVHKHRFTPLHWNRAEIREVIKDSLGPLPRVIDLVREYNGKRASRVIVTMFFGQTGIGEMSDAFHKFLKEAISKGSMMLYDGHSGLGGNIYLPAIERYSGMKMYPNKNRYQIFYFNSCSSYAYFNKLFFKRKRSDEDPKGTKNLDIITTGLETAFEGGVRTNLALILAAELYARTGQKTGYEKIIERLQNDNLAGVNGDEDNPRSR